MSVVARGAHLAAIRANGLTVEAPDATINVKLPASDDPAELGPQDAVIVTVKAPALPAVEDHRRQIGAAQDRQRRAGPVARARAEEPHGPAVEHAERAQASREHGLHQVFGRVGDARADDPRQRALLEQSAREHDVRRALAAGEGLHQHPGRCQDAPVRPDGRVTGERALDLLALGQIAFDVFVDLAAADRGGAAEVLAQADVPHHADDARVSDRRGEADPRVAFGEPAGARVLDVGAGGAGAVGVDGDPAQRPVPQHLQRHLLVILGQAGQQQPGRQASSQRDRPGRSRFVPARRFANGAGRQRGHDPDRHVRDHAANDLVSISSCGAFVGHCALPAGGQRHALASRASSGESCSVGPFRPATVCSGDVVAHAPMTNIVTPASWATLHMIQTAVSFDPESRAPARTGPAIGIQRTSDMLLESRSPGTVAE